MIATLLRVSWTNLKRDRVAQALTFLLPVLFFSIFATVFGNQGRDGTSRVRIAVVDEDGSELSRRIVAGLQQEAALRVRVTADTDGKGAPLDRAAAEQLVRNGAVPVAVILPQRARRRCGSIRTGRRRAAHSTARRRFRSGRAANGATDCCRRSP